MADYETLRLENLKQKQELLAQLNLDSGVSRVAKRVKRDPETKQPTKKRKLNTSTNPVRSSARIGSSEIKPSYTDDGENQTHTDSKPRNKKHRASGPKPSSTSTTGESNSTPISNIDSLRSGWSSWTPSAPAPTRDASTGTLHFVSHPSFQPNKTPSEILHEGSFGGSYFRPLYSKTLGVTIRDDYLELPTDWLRNLSIPTYLTSPTYNASINKYAVACGQSIEEWEAAGWINYNFDARGWFQWYCRFYQGRRCDDDERQVGRWARCVGATGRWRRALLKKYVAMGVREVFDDGEESVEVSPVMHQTCHHWAFEVRQGHLDEFWRTGR